MHLDNRSPYDTRHLRRVAVRAFHSLSEKNKSWLKLPRPWWRNLKIHVVLTGAHIPKFNFGRESGHVYVRVPKLTGDEWHQITRDSEDGRALLTQDFANIVRAQICDPLDSFAVDPYWLRKLPKVVPLKHVNPKAPPRDALQVKWERAVLYEKSWIRKQKLAGTKVKSYRRKRIMYEKRLAARKAAT